MSSHSDPKLLFSIPGIQAYHVQDGSSSSLTPSGPQTLSLLMVSTSSAFSSVEPSEEDFYLHLNLPPELDLPLPATTQIYHQPPSSYLIPRWDLGPDSGAFTRIEFPEKANREDVDTFETILAQCTSFLERTPAPTGRVAPRPSEKGGALPPYDPSGYGPGEAYAAGSSAHKGGQIVLIDEENGSVVGELGEGFNIVENSKMKNGSKDPVEITLPQDGQHTIGVAPASQEYLEMAMHPAYKNSTLVSTAATASRLIVTTSGFVGKTLNNQANNFTQKTKPNPEPMTFKPATQAHIRRIHTFTEGAAGLSAKTVGQVTKHAQNFGAAMAKRGTSDKAHKGIGPDGKPVDGYKPGILNKSLMAFSTILDGVDQAGRNILTSTSSAATTVVGHKYGAEAGKVSESIGGGVKNVGLVYIDAAGVSRKAVLKSVAKGMVVGKVRGKNGQMGEIMVGGGDGGVYQVGNEAGAGPSGVVGGEKMSGGNGSGTSTGTHTPPAYGAASGQNYYPPEKQGGSIKY